MSRGNTRKRPIRGSILHQVALLFVLGILATGLITLLSQSSVSYAGVKRQTEDLAAEIADEVERSVREYPAGEWLIQYWYDHADELDIEYDADYTDGTETERKARLLGERYPDLVLEYVDAGDLETLPEADRKLYAEIAYSWLITRVDEIKRAHGVDYLFCVLTDNSFEDQFFLFSAADPGAVRGTNYEEVYTLGTTVTVTESQREAMRAAVQSDAHLADAGGYVDYYSCLAAVGDRYVLIGMTYDLTGLRSDVRTQTWRSTAFAVAYQILLSLLCLGLIYHYVLHPLKDVQRNIRLYKNTKDSAPVVEDLAGIRPNNEIGRLSEDISDLAEEIDAYTERIETITAEKERVNTELNMATQIQEGMLPNIYPAFPERSEFDVYATMDPAREVGGDFYDFFLVDDDHLCVVMADVAGKGVPAALFMMASKIILKDNAMMRKSPAQILTDTNAAICDNNRMGMFVTVWLGILEISTGKLTAANAGHEYPAIKRRDGGFALYKDKHGFVVGGMEGVKYKEYELTLEPGDKLFLYTDGVPEATDADDALFGTERMLAALNADAEAATVQILKNVRKSVDAFVQDAEQFDDLTMLCLEYKGKDT